MRRLPFFVLAAGILIFALGSSMSRVLIDEGSEQDFPICEYAEPLDIDPLPVTELDDSELHASAPRQDGFPSIEQLKLIGRMARGVIRVAHHKGGGKWWECGTAYSEEEEQDAALDWAYRIVFLSWEYSDVGTDGGFIMEPWGVFGTAANECGFDRCALGLYPRKWAYQEGIIKKRRRCISHTAEEISRAVMSEDGLEQWRSTGIDSGPLHELWLCRDSGCKPKYNISLPRIPFSEVMSLGKGFEYNVRQMRKRADRNSTNRPWRWWRGSETHWYDEKIVRWARMGGASLEEIGPAGPGQRKDGRR